MKLINFREKSTLVASMLTSRLINSFRNPSLLKYHNILCIKDDEIGDMCYSLHVFKMLRNQYPDANITVLCKPYSVPLLQSDPSVSRIITDKKERTGDYDLIIDLKVTWKSMAYALRVWPKARLDRGTVRFADAFQKKYPHEVETNYKVVVPVISPANQVKIPVLVLSENDNRDASKFMEENNLHQFAMMHISARRVLRQWPAENYAAIAKYMHDVKGWDIVFVGGPGEEDDIAKVMKALPFTTCSTAGKLSLSSLAALMKRASLFIGNESGPLHIAALMKLPCIGLYGPGPQFIFYPFGNTSTYIHHVLECNPCDQIHCVHPENPCIRRITIAEVTEHIKKMIA